MYGKPGNVKNNKAYFRELVFQCGFLNETTRQTWVKGGRVVLGDEVVMVKGTHRDLLYMLLKILSSISSHCKTPDDFKAGIEIIR